MAHEASPHCPVCGETLKDSAELTQHRRHHDRTEAERSAADSSRGSDANRTEDRKNKRFERSNWE